MPLSTKSHIRAGQIKLEVLKHFLMELKPFSFSKDYSEVSFAFYLLVQMLEALQILKEKVIT